MKIKLQIAILWIILFSITVHAQQTINPKFEQKIEELIDHSVATISCERLQEKMKTQLPPFGIIFETFLQQYSLHSLKLQES